MVASVGYRGIFFAGSVLSIEHPEFRMQDGATRDPLDCDNDFSTEKRKLERLPVL